TTSPAPSISRSTSARSVGSSASTPGIATRSSTQCATRSSPSWSTESHGFRRRPGSSPRRPDRPARHLRAARPSPIAMCGIVTFFSRSHPISEEALRSATEVLHHRGPDGRKQWISPQRTVGLGHARLSIIDLETGDQPLANEDGSVHAVVNGEFYDFQRVRESLEAGGHHFSTRSDSEILLHLYEDLGPACLHHLRGEFAF